MEEIKRMLQQISDTLDRCFPEEINKSEESDRRNNIIGMQNQRMKNMRAKEKKEKKQKIQSNEFE